MTVDHEFTHNVIAGLSFTKEGRTLVENLEAMRYYHRDGKSFYLGDGARLIVSYNESPRVHGGQQDHRSTVPAW